MDIKNVFFITSLKIIHSNFSILKFKNNLRTIRFAPLAPTSSLATQDFLCCTLHAPLWLHHQSKILDSLHKPQNKSCDALLVARGILNLYFKFHQDSIKDG